MRTTTTPAKCWPGLKADAIYWNENGETACGCHTPYPGSDSWYTEEWQPMTDAEQDAMAREIGKAVTCATCDAIKRNNG